MYEEYLQYVLDLIKVLNQFEKDHPEPKDPTKAMLQPYIGNPIKILLEGSESGFLVDEIGGSWSLTQDWTPPKEKAV